MLTFSTGTKIKGPHRQTIGNALEMSKPLKKSEFGPREGGELITYTPETHGQSSCMHSSTTGNNASHNNGSYVLESSQTVTVVKVVCRTANAHHNLNMTFYTSSIAISTISLSC